MRSEGLYLRCGEQCRTGCRCGYALCACAAGRGARGGAMCRCGRWQYRGPWRQCGAGGHGRHTGGGHGVQTGAPTVRLTCTRASARLPHRATSNRQTANTLERSFVFILAYIRKGDRAAVFCVNSMKKNDSSATQHAGNNRLHFRYAEENTADAVECSTTDTAQGQRSETGEETPLGK